MALSLNICDQKSTEAFLLTREIIKMWNMEVLHEWESNFIDIQNVTFMFQSMLYKTHLSLFSSGSLCLFNTSFNPFTPNYSLWCGTYGHTFYISACSLTVWTLPKYAIYYHNVPSHCSGCQWLPNYISSLMIWTALSYTKAFLYVQRVYKLCLTPM